VKLSLHINECTTLFAFIYSHRASHRAISTICIRYLQSFISCEHVCRDSFTQINMRLRVTSFIHFQLTCALEYVCVCVCVCACVCVCVHKSIFVCVSHLFQFPAHMFHQFSCVSHVSSISVTISQLLHSHAGA